MSDKHRLDLETQVKQSRSVKALSAENSRLRAQRDRYASARAAVEIILCEIHNGTRSKWIREKVSVARAALAEGEGA